MIRSLAVDFLSSFLIVLATLAIVDGIEAHNRGNPDKALVKNIAATFFLGVAIALLR